MLVAYEYKNSSLSGSSVRSRKQEYGETAGTKLPGAHMPNLGAGALFGSPNERQKRRSWVGVMVRSVRVDYLLA